MAYFSQRYGYRKTITEKTYTISIEMYSLLFDCCENYFKNIAWKYPMECPDGRGCCGLSESKLINDLIFEIPDLYGVDSYSTLGWFKHPTRATGFFNDEDSQYNQYALLDFIEFVAQNCRDITKSIHHGYYGHDDLTFGTSNVCKYEFIKDINAIFKKTGLLYCVNQKGEVERIIENGVLSEEIEKSIPTIKEIGIQELLNEAIALHKNPHPEARKDAIEKIWDAFERLKSYYATKQQEKLSSIDKIITDISGGQEYIKQLFDKEFKTLTNEIGNACHIRHSEVWQVDITDIRHYDYFFNRCLSIIALAIQYLK